VPITIRPLAPADAGACDAIMRGLPDFFAYEPGLADCARAVRSQDGWVADEDGRVVGFATWETRTLYSAEITWMAVERSRRHGGVGTAILHALTADLRGRGFVLALAMTSAASKQADSGPDTYEATRRFWLARGFLPLIELDIWETDVALLQVRALVVEHGAT
jgi:GNAT superfamily N-acetyltransferase